MEYRLSLGAWGSVFAVPTELVDKHLRLAGGVQLKVMLYLLRNSEKNLSASDIAEALSLPAADVRDSMLYWEQTGLVKVCNGIVTPPECVLSEQQSVKGVVSEAAADAVNIISEKNEVGAAVKNETKTPEKPSRSLTRPEKPDSRYLSRRMEEDESIAYLMRTADEIFGRLTNNSDKATLLLIHEHDGLPVAVIIMLLQYACDIGKCNMRYIEKMAISWADAEITTIDRAEQKIKTLTDGRSAAGKVQRVFGLEAHSPTEKESELAGRWVNEWKFNDEMLRLAYETCVDVKQKYIPKYVDTILARWHNSGIKTPGDVSADSEKNRQKKPKSYGAAYDISEYESISAYDEE